MRDEGVSDLVSECATVVSALATLTPRNEKYTYQKIYISKYISGRIHSIHSVLKIENIERKSLCV